MSKQGERPGLEIVVDGRPVRARPGDSVAAALWNEGVRTLRQSIDGQPRSWLCAMGSCFECVVEIDGRPQRACITPCISGMRISLGTGETVDSNGD